MHHRSIRRALLPTLAAGGIVVATAAAPASAHVTVTPDTTAAGSYAVLTFSVGHGCEGSPTTAIEIAMPEQVLQVTPTRNPSWDVEKVSEQLDEPVTDAHGNEVTERVAQVVYTARTPLADGYRDTFELSLQLPDAEGETLTFPVVQKCEQGETGWVETPAEGQDPEELERPAPALTVTAADGAGHGAETATEEEDTDSDGAGSSADAEGSDESGDSDGLAIAGLVAGIAGVVVGGAALVRSGRTSS
ncbi:uncharacterized protein YcnI [Nocardioides thalensis]|uniref:Uncharacterized protein YcnI n=1 Tax=Nocardioides thalensis TaxID=1914755 RepID=A0A853C088_9ACTN|nr:YcnI family protein [Nocardioides thalensis]NYJ00567.1 uncharacterized protein YcnI [Nocardioides thalensis]